MVLRQFHSNIVVGGVSMKNNKKYNIGLDIGTTSVGWAVVESESQKIFRKGNQALWGVRLFEEANTAEERRAFRSIRRRYDRRRGRIRLLQEEFMTEIDKTDSTFFIKLKESFYHESDKNNKTVLLTKREKEEIKAYHKRYKTIYHLRKELITSSNKQDIRLVYLALHHMIKYRGNFLYHVDGFNIENLDLNEQVKIVLNSITNLCSFLGCSEDYDNYLDIKKFTELLLESSKAKRKEELQKILKNLFPKSFINEFIKLVNGNKFNFIKMLNLEVEESKIELSFDGTDYEEKYVVFESILGEHMEILTAMKQLYDMIFLKKLFHGSKSISLSSLMVEKYVTHEQDLRFLKDLFQINRKIYNKIFRSKKDSCIYEKYIKNKISNDEFIKEIQKYLPEIFDKSGDRELLDTYELEVKNRMENGEFLPRITDTENGKYPYQLNKDELIKIIENQGKYYPFLLDKLEDGTYKLVKLLEFKVPYYVGPLTDETHSNFAWMIRKNNIERITPYNFDKIVDKEATAEKFIKRMISHCTYLLEESAMPNHSILYSKYKVMNELKQIKVNGERLTNNFQQKILKELFMKVSGGITDKKFKEYLYASKEVTMYQGDISVTGYSADGKFANTMQSYVDFFGENGIFDGTIYNEENAEEIIEWITIFEDKDILETKIRKKYSKLNEIQIKKIIAKKYHGWGNLSKRLLMTKYYVEKESGIPKSIMDLMTETKDNFMQIINNEDYHFQKMISDYNKVDTTKKIDYSFVENLVTSPSIKRGIYQALKVVEEIVKFMGMQPQAIMIEMARGGAKKERRDDKKKYLTKLYEKEKDSIHDYYQLMKELGEFEKIDSQKLFLYFIQEGKSLYSGRPLNIEDLDSYEIDHIIPRTLIKDDSIDNKALVYREENQIKAASYILPSKYRTEINIKWWQHLKSINLMSQKKYYNLIRKQYKTEDIDGFINRQLVETRQITKHVASILGNYYNKSKILYLPVNLSHNYRKRFDLFKFREINDYHHAHDAYLAAVLGEYKEKYLRKKVNFEMLKELNKKLLEQKDYNKLKYGYVINSLDYSMNKVLKSMILSESNKEVGELSFDAEGFNKRVEDTLYRNDILISRKTEIRTGEFYNQTKNKKNLPGVCLKKNLPTKLYGSYTSLNPAYAVFVKYTKRGKKEQRFIGMPIYIIESSKSDLSIQSNYIRDLLKLNENDVLEFDDRKIPFLSLIDWDGQICYLVGAADTIEVCNAKQFKFDKNSMKRFKYTLNQVFNVKNRMDTLNEEEYEKNLGELIRYIVDKMEKEYSLYQNLILNLKNIVCYDYPEMLSIEEKEQSIKELFKLLNCRSTTANFKFLNSKYSTAFGRKNQRVINHAKVFNKSITGIRESVYEF